MAVETRALTGRELDNLLASKLMGYGEPHEVFLEGCRVDVPWAFQTVYKKWPGPKDNGDFTNWVKVGGPRGKRLPKPYWVAPHYHRDVDKAMEALCAARKLVRAIAKEIAPETQGDLAYFEIKAFDGQPEPYYCRIDVMFSATGTTIAEAVSRAALKVAEWAEGVATPFDSCDVDEEGEG